MSDDPVKIDKLAFGGEFEDLLSLFLELHNCVNDPETRDKMAERKVELIERLVTEKLSKRSAKDWKVERLTRVHKETGVLTHNLIVTVGNPKTGPNTILFVHHDVIKANKNGDSIPLSVGDDGNIYGQTIQDDTIHLAATIEILDKVLSPKSGAISFVFTDFEENGCRGSGAIAEELPLGKSNKFPVGLISLESTNSKLGLGHKGKLRTDLVLNQKNIGVMFCSFYERLFGVEKSANLASNSKLGRTAGTSTYGVVSSESGLRAILDFRTNEITSPKVVLEMLRKGNFIETKPVGLSIWEIVKNQFESRIVRFEVNGDGIFLSSDSGLLHPANFDPNNNQTVLPLLYLIVRSLEEMGKSGKIIGLSWGDENKQNSNPVEAKVLGNFGLDQNEWKEMLMGKSKELVENKLEAEEVEFGFEKTVLTDAAISPNDARLDGIVSLIGLETTYLQFMTDAAKPFSVFKKEGFETYVFVMGVGAIENLHQVEKISKADCEWVTEKILKLVEVVQKTLTE